MEFLCTIKLKSHIQTITATCLSQTKQCTSNALEIIPNFRTRNTNGSNKFSLCKN